MQYGHINSYEHVIISLYVCLNC